MTERALKAKCICPQCGGSKGFYAPVCRDCKTDWPKPLLGKKGSQHSAWKGGHETDRDGYLRTYAPDHPWPRKNGYVRENVRVMELHIGRRIARDEAVHHRDHDRTNNALENLELVKWGAHSRHHRHLDTARRLRTPDGRFA